jgi:hypothetical protein
MNNAANYVYSNGLPKSEQGFDKEVAQIAATIDRFFGTDEGFKKIEETTTVVDGIASYLKKIFKRDKTVKNVFDEMTELGLMLCGGAINSTFTNAKVNDLDFYMKDASKIEEAKEFLSRWFPIKFESTNAITYKRKDKQRVYTVQLITRFSGQANEIFDWFDFTITHGAYDFEDKRFYFGIRFFPDLAKRRLVYSGASQYPICAMYRTGKYVKRGYELPGATTMHIALSIVQLKIENYKDLKEQLMGIDTIYLQKLLDKKDPASPVNYGEFVYEAFQLIDRINGMTQAEEEDE